MKSQCNLTKCQVINLIQWKIAWNNLKTLMHLIWDCSIYYYYQLITHFVQVWDIYLLQHKQKIRIMLLKISQIIANKGPGRYGTNDLQSIWSGPNKNTSILRYAGHALFHRLWHTYHPSHEFTTFYNPCLAVFC